VALATSRRKAQLSCRRQAQLQEAVPLRFQGALPVGAAAPHACRLTWAPETRPGAARRRDVGHRPGARLNFRSRWAVKKQRRGEQSRGMHNDVEAITSILERYMSRVNARVLVARALQERGVSEKTVTREELVKCSPALRRGIELFVSPRLQPEALDRFREFFRARSDSSSCRIELKKEADISTARAEARRLCENAGASAFSMQKVTTIVSELARNIVLYAEQGIIELGFINKNKNGQIIVTAVDNGPGIPNLNQILGGQYQSRTGLGKGLLGTKRLADRFQISTSNQGTSITAEVTL
jgi:serine/threonine-protein kinase RsbT